MFRKALEYYSRINTPAIPEESIGFRVAVLVCVLLSVYAAIRSGGVSLGFGIAVFVGVAVGSYYSYRTRSRPNVLLKIILTVVLLVVFAFFLADLTGWIYDLRYPLVELFLWLLVLHSFDLPARRDLDFSLVSATVLMGFAASLSLSSDFIYLLALFFLAGLVALYLERRSVLVFGSDLFAGSRRSPRRAVVIACIAVLPLTLGLFVALPRLPGFSTNFLPMSSHGDTPDSFEGMIRNPGYRDIPDRFPDVPMPFNPSSYYGFNKFLDLRVRGVPPEVVVMKVRSSLPAYWKNMSFDMFLGNGWEYTARGMNEMSSQDLPLKIRYGEPPGQPTRELVQTFHIEQQLPNTVFAAHIPYNIYFPTHFLKYDSMGTVLVPVTLDPGLIYTVVSEVSQATPEMLRYAIEVTEPDLKERFCQLPEMSPAIARLAAEVTKNETNDYDKVDALCNYLSSTYEYDLNCPRQENEENTVEFFLFREKRGYCEHFATALAVMARTLGIPSRLAVGFETGDLNPLTGHYEVTSRDAHAWAEIYFHPFGWIPFDPTPGSADPAALSGGETTWSGLLLFRRMGKALSKLFPASWGRAIKSVAGGFAKAVSSGASALARLVADNWAWILVVLGALLAAGFALIWVLKTARLRSPLAMEGGSPRQRAVESFERLSRILQKAGFPRRVSQTPLEYAVQVDGCLGTVLVVGIAMLFNHARFGRGDPEPGELGEMENMVDEVEARLSGRSRGLPGAGAGF